MRISFAMGLGAIALLLSMAAGSRAASTDTYPEKSAHPAATATVSGGSQASTTLTGASSTTRQKTLHTEAASQRERTARDAAVECRCVENETARSGDDNCPIGRNDRYEIEVCDR